MDLLHHALGADGGGASTRTREIVRRLPGLAAAWSRGAPTGSPACALLIHSGRSLTADRLRGLSGPVSRIELRVRKASSEGGSWRPPAARKRSWMVGATRRPTEAI